MNYAVDNGLVYGMSCDDNNISPKVTILMAIYRPKLDWLIKQLISLNMQTYKNLELIACNDDPEYYIEPELFEKHIKSFPYKLTVNEKNIGSNKTFERLTEMATGEYIAYCDQDDIWQDNKIELLLTRIKNTGAELCCSDLIIVDENDKVLADSITKVRKRHIFKEGDNLAPELIVRNFVTGCAMLIKTETAKAAIPFESYMVHDHWLALFSALRGKLAFEPTPTVRYRQHSYNQTAVLTGISTKEDYFTLRIELLINRAEALKERFKYCDDEHFVDTLDNVRKWVYARKQYFYNHKFVYAREIWRYKSFGVSPSLFEIAMPVIPNGCFFKVINLIK